MGAAADDLVDPESGTLDELMLYLEALVVRARLIAVTAAIVAADGDGAAALRMVTDAEVDIRSRYHDLHNRVAALAKIGPEASTIGRWVKKFGERVPLPLPGTSSDAWSIMQQLDRIMNERVGVVLPREPIDAAVELPVQVVVGNGAPSVP